MHNSLLDVCHSQIALHSQIILGFHSQIILHFCSQITCKDWSKISQSLMFTYHSQSLIVGHISHIPFQIVHVFSHSLTNFLNCSQSFTHKPSCSFIDHLTFTGSFVITHEPPIIQIAHVCSMFTLLHIHPNCSQT
jgi:hypothetical protein